MVGLRDETGKGSTATQPTMASRTGGTGRGVAIGLALAIGLAAFLRFWHLGSQSIWYDEFVTTQDVHNRFAEMLISALPHTEGSPPLYFILQWLWLPIAGRGDAAVRSLAALAGIATVPVVYVLARELRQTSRVALVAAFLVATNPLFVWYSQEARPYSLLALTGAVSVLMWARALRLGRRSDFVWWGVAAAAAFCTHYFAIFLIVPELVWLLRASRARPPAGTGSGHSAERDLREDRERRRDVWWGCVPLAIVVVPLGLLAIAQRGKNQAWIGDFPLELRFAEMGRSYLVGPAEPFGEWWVLGAAIVVAAAVVALRWGAPNERSAARTMVLLGLSGYALALLAAFAGADYILGRNLIASLIPLLVVVAIGLGTRRAGWLGLVATVVLCAGSTLVVGEVAARSVFQKPDWRGVAAILDHGGKDRAIVVDAYLGAPLERYLDQTHSFDKKHRRRMVGSIDLIYRVPKADRRCGRWSGLGCETFFFPRLPAALGRDFALVHRVHHAGFIINRYEAAHPRRLTKRQVLGADHKKTSFVIFPASRPDREAAVSRESSGQASSPARPRSRPRPATARHG
ncbi:MAG TPA: glycosyltransferase family 39 protein [Acidimicrobiia bacterium]